MKLVIQIPCLNEETTLPATVADLPKEIEGIDQIEVLVVDDGSTDRTSEVARELGVDHIVRLETNHGLARAFMKGVEHALAAGADIVVNTDADNQYKGADIEKLVAPIVKNEADMVVGCRPIADHPEFGIVKKVLQVAGSWLLRQVSKTTVRDAASGFRALSRDTCMRMFTYTRFSYCMETLVQAGTLGLRIHSADIGVNPKTRESRLFSSILEYLMRSGWTIIYMFILYRPGRFFGLIGTALLALTLGLGFRYIYLVFLQSNPDPSRTYLPSLILLAICGVVGILSFFFGLLGEVLRSQRRITEENLYHLRRKRFSEGVG